MLAATGIGKAFTESQTGVFRDEETGELKMEPEKAPTLLSEMIKAYDLKYQTPEYYEKEHGKTKPDLPPFLDLERIRKEKSEGMDYAKGGIAGLIIKG